MRGIYRVSTLFFFLSWRQKQHKIDLYNSANFIHLQYAVVFSFPCLKYKRSNNKNKNNKKKTIYNNNNNQKKKIHTIIRKSCKFDGFFFKIK